MNPQKTYKFAHTPSLYHSFPPRLTSLVENVRRILKRGIAYDASLTSPPTVPTFPAGERMTLKHNQ